MAIRVALLGTRNCGRLALTQLIEDPRVAADVSNREKVGRDTGDLAGLEVTTGITGTLVLTSIPDVVAVEPGLRTTLDLPLVTGKGTCRG